MPLSSKPSKYPYKARQNALLSIQLYEGLGPIDLKMVSNLSDDSDCLFPNIDFDAIRHGELAAEFINEHADGNTLVFLIKFITSMNSRLTTLSTKNKEK